MKILRNVLVTLAVLVLALLGLGMLLPAQWKVERSIVINAPAKAIYPLVSDLKKGWPQWSAFDAEDPTISYSYSGPDQGAGALRSWTSKKMGDGSQVITKADPSGVEFRLQMANGFGMDGSITLAPQGKATKVTWSDAGTVGRNPVFRIMASMMDKMMGPKFDSSLAALKAKAEAGAKP